MSETTQTTDDLVMGVPRARLVHQPNVWHCWSTCAAILLGVDPLAIPCFALRGRDWYEQMQRWFTARGVGVVTFPTNLDDPTVLDPYFDHILIAAGPSQDDPHPQFDHAVLWKRGQLLHDPKAGGHGLARIDSFDVLSILDLPLAARSFR